MPPFRSVTRPMPATLQIILLLTASNVFMTFAMFYMHQPVKLDYLWAGLCILGAVYFIFRA